MKKNLKIVIIGRRNVGKSTLFNLFAGYRKSIVADFPGVTRDVIISGEGPIQFLDTPGLDLLMNELQKPEEKELDKRIVSRTEAVIAAADAAILVTAAPDLHPYDFRLAELLRKSGIPTLVVVNKMDSDKDLMHLGNFFELGFDELIPMSALKKWNLFLLQEKLAFVLSREFQVDWDFEFSGGPKKGQRVSLRDKAPSIAIVGRPNAGKSTLLNRLLREEKALVSDIPGTTRDTVDSEMIYYGKKIILTDTAGIRKAGRRRGDFLEFFSFERTEEAIRNSHAVLHILDSAVGITDTDKKILDLCLGLGKQVVFVLNKWDLMKEQGETPDAFWKKLQGKFPLLADFPYISVSGQDGMRVVKLLDMALKIIAEAGTHVPTSTINKTLESIMANRRVVSKGGRFRMYYMTQVDVYPPTFVVFANHPDLIQNNTVKYMERLIKQGMGFEHCVIKLHVRGRKPE